MRDNKEKITVKFNTLIIWISALSGLIYIATSFKYGLNDDSFILSVIELFNSISETILSAVAVSLILEKSTINDKIKNAFIDLLNTNFPLHSYSPQKLEELNCKIACIRSDNNDKDMKKSLYAALEPQLLSFTSGLYYNYHNSTVKISPDEKSGYFNKTVEMEYEVVNANSYNNHIKIELMLYTVNDQPISKASDIFSIEKFEVNNTNLIKEASSCLELKEIPAEDGVTYKYHIIFYRKLQNCKIHRVKIRYKYISPITDLIQSYRVGLPSKRFEHNIIVNHNANSKSLWDIKTNAYSTRWDDNPLNRLSVEHRTKQNCTVKSDSWVLPGAGYVIYFTKEK